jgi:hypothetical protein
MFPLHLPAAMYDWPYRAIWQCAPDPRRGFGTASTVGLSSHLGRKVPAFHIWPSAAQTSAFRTAMSKITHTGLVDPRSTNDGSNWTVPGESPGAPLA